MYDTFILYSDYNNHGGDMKRYPGSITLTNPLAIGLSSGSFPVGAKNWHAVSVSIQENEVRQEDIVGVSLSGVDSSVPINSTFPVKISSVIIDLSLTAEQWLEVLHNDLEEVLYSAILKAEGADGTKVTLHVLPINGRVSVKNIQLLDKI